MKVDLHVHTRWSPDAVSSPQKIVDRCLRAGLGCIAITDHNTIHGALEVQRLAPFFVIVGEEIKTTAGDIIGLFLWKEIPKCLSPLETVGAIKEQGGLVSIPHPLDRFRRSAMRGSVLETLIPHVDIIEGFNSRTLLQRYNRKALEVAQQHDIPVAAVSDAHSATELGHTYAEMEDFEVSAPGLKAALFNATLVTRRANPLLRLVPSLARLRRLFG